MSYELRTEDKLSIAGFNRNIVINKDLSLQEGLFFYIALNTNIKKSTSHIIGAAFSRTVLKFY
jgi:hypothetical protein